MIDLHCHVVPGLDDGPQTLEDSLALCRAASDAGTTMLIATPHVNWSYLDVNAAAVHTGVAAVNAAVHEASIGVHVRAGAEIALSRLADVSDAEIGVLRLGGGPYSLVECPHHGGAPIGIRRPCGCSSSAGTRSFSATRSARPSFRPTHGCWRRCSMQACCAASRRDR